MSAVLLWSLISHLSGSSLLESTSYFVWELCCNSAKWKRKTKINEATWIQKLRIKLQTLFIDLSTTVMQITVAQECNMCCLQYDSGNTNCTEQQPSSTSHYAYKQTYCTDKTLIHFYRDSEKETDEWKTQGHLPKTLVCNMWREEKKKNKIIKKILLPKSTDLKESIPLKN